MKWKISLDDEEILRKRRVQTRNFSVSSDHEAFTCGGQACIMDLNFNRSKKHINPEINFGIGKKESKVSNRNLVSGYLGNINGGS